MKMMKNSLLSTHDLLRNAHIAKIGALAGVVAFLSTPGFAADASCTAMIEATIPKPNAPYRGTQSIALGGGKTMENKMIYIGGTMHMQIAGSTTWTAASVGDLKALTAETAKLTSRCEAGASELLGTTLTRVWTSQIKSPVDGSLSEQKLWIGVADGRVHRQKTASVDQRLYYDNVVAPKVAGK
jgi:hypothetical protein